MNGARVALIVVGAMVAIWSSSRWREAVQLGMVLLILEGAMRKWLFPGSQDLIYFAKDVVFLGAYIGFMQQRPTLAYRPVRIPMLDAALGISVAYGLAEIFNPELPNILVGALGFKAYFFYVPLLYLLPAAFPDDRTFAVFLRRYVLISVPVGILGILQFFSPPGSALNTYARGGEDTAYVSTFGSSEFVRVTATFSYITGYASYLLATVILVLAVLGIVQWRLQKNLALYAALAMTFLGMLMTGSRGPVVILALLFPIYWYLAVIRERQSGATLGRLLLGLGLVGGFLVTAGPEALGAFQGRAAGSGGEDFIFRMLLPFYSPFLILSDAGLFGVGIGATHQMAASVTHGIVPYSWVHGVVTEVESGRILLELGPLGFLLIYGVRVHLILLSLAQVMKMRVAFHRGIAIGCFLFFLAQLPGGVVFDVTADVYFWFFAGLLFLVMRLDREAILAARRPIPAEARVESPTAAPPEPVPELPPAPSPSPTPKVLRPASWPPLPRPRTD